MVTGERRLRVRLRHGLAWCGVLVAGWLSGVARAEPIGAARVLEGPFDGAALDRRLEQCPDGARAVGKRQRRATVNRLQQPFRAAYVTHVACGDETHEYLVVSVADAAFVERIAVIEKPASGGRALDPFESLLLRGEPGRPQLWLTLLDGSCRRALWIGVGPSGKPSVVESAKECAPAPGARRAAIAPPAALRFP